MSTLGILFTIWGFTIVLSAILFITDYKRQPKVKKLLIAKTIIPLEYTGKDYEKWIEQIKIERQILSIKNDSDFMLNLMLKSKLMQENIFTITK